MAGKMKVPDGWRIVRLGDVADVNRGASWSRAQESSVPMDDAIPVVRIGNVQRDGFRMDDVLYIRGVSASEKSRGSIAHRTLVMVGSNGNRDRVGNIFLADQQLLGHLLASFLVGIAPVVGTSERFLAASLRSAQIQSLITESTAGSTGLKNLSLTWLRNLPILLPPLLEQRAIAAVLDSIDEAIEGVEAVITAIERLRDALLHELHTRGVPGLHTQWKDVPGIGTIPTAWKVVRLGDECKRITKGTTPTTLGRQYTSLGVRFIRVENVSDDGVISGGETRFIDQDTHNLLSRSVLKENDLILSIAGALGRSALIMEDVLPANVNQALAIIRLAQGSRILPGFLSFVFRGRPMQLQVNDMRVELAQANISLEQVGRLLIPLPPLPEQRAITAVLDGVDDVVERAREERDALRSLKEATADALLTGRVRVGVIANG